ncbi:Retinal guanylyl cyclase 1 [Taenia solium]|eukprot:TsM_000184400 transcript=TsM_000184400 gene=TsM_000184400
MRMKTQMAELEEEKRKEERPICQSEQCASGRVRLRWNYGVVAEALKASFAGVAKTYDEVSVCISNIAKLTNICAMSTSLRSVDLLSSMYTLFDRTTAHYDFYKVDFIRHAQEALTMVTLGMPLRNGPRHAAEISTTTLHLLSACASVTTNYISHVSLGLHISLHSGACIVGVVRLTMSRYCLFSNTVNRVLRMELSRAVQWNPSSRTSLSPSPQRKIYLLQPLGYTSAKR